MRFIFKTLKKVKFLRFIKSTLVSLNIKRIVLKAFLKDFYKYLMFSKTFNKHNKNKIEASIIQQYHVIEKGLSMPSPKNIFGLDVVKNLIQNIELFIKYFGDDNEQVKSAIYVLQCYSDHIGLHESIKIKNLSKILSNYNHNNNGGTLNMDIQNFNEKRVGNFAKLVEVRKSYRNYSDKSLKMQDLYDAIELASHSPSVCNRQSCKVFLTTKKDKITNILNLQNGNRGFGNLSKGVIIVTSDLNIFESYKERNQAYIDGGMFSMSLLYALTFKGLGTCSLNWCASFENDEKLREYVNIPKNHVIIMLISMGYIPNDLKHAYSFKRNINNILTNIN